MRSNALAGLLALTAWTAAVAPAPALAQAPPTTTKAATPPAAAAAPSAAAFNQVLGTVNSEPISRGDLINFLSRYRIPLGDEQQNRQVYHDAMESLINNRLLFQYLARQKFPVSEEKINERLAILDKQLKQDGTDLATELQKNTISKDALHKEMANQVRWVEFLDGKATDAELKRFATAHKDLFSGTQIKASHILLKVDPSASAADKEKVRLKLLQLKKDIDSNKISFAEAANKNSEDPANSEGAGGDVGYFGLGSGFIEEFATAAFALPKGALSDLVETPYGLHLILVTDRKEGARFDFEQDKPRVKLEYASDLQKQVLTAERKTAKIDIKPMPADLLPTATATAPAPAAGDAAKKGAEK
jgi:peptidyl-prolyl cis-trans isomerase C